MDSCAGDSRTCATQPAAPKLATQPAAPKLKAKPCAIPNPIHSSYTPPPPSSHNLIHSLPFPTHSHPLSRRHHPPPWRQKGGDDVKKGGDGMARHLRAPIMPSRTGPNTTRSTLNAKPYNTTVNRDPHTLCPKPCT